MVTRREILRLLEEQREADTGNETARSVPEIADQVARIRELAGPDWLREIAERKKIADSLEFTRFQDTIKGIQSTTQTVERISEDRARARERETQILEELKAIRQELEGERRAREELQERVKVQEHELEQTRYVTGLPGRPGSSHLAVTEFSRRVNEGELEPTLREQATALENWLRDTHPDAAPITAKTIENAIRTAYRNATA